MTNSEPVFLVVDDFEPMRKVAAGQLRSLPGSTVIESANGLDALRILQRQHIDLVLSDWNMPVMNGLELLCAMRLDTGLSHVPFIMITAETDRVHIEEAIANGVSDLLIKPYTAHNLTRRVEKAMTSRQNSIAPRTVPLPTKSEESDDVTLAQSTDRPIAGIPRILLVDDAADNLMLLSNLFRHDYHVQIAHTGQKALDICQSNNPPDLVLLDIMMPGMDGFEVIRHMRQHPTSESIPVIIITSLTGEEVRLKCLSMGAVDFVTKPIEPAELNPRVRNFLRYVALHKQLQANYDNMLELARLRKDVEHMTRHDMRGPLAGVIALLRALSNDATMSTAHADQLHVAEQAALTVLNMINLSSELYKIETGRFQLDPKPVKIGEILSQIAEISGTAFGEKHLHVNFSPGETVERGTPDAQGDAMLCYSLFQNLVKNACEAAPDNSVVTISVKDEAPLRVVIENSGTVPATIRQRFFDKNVTYGKNNGNGIGTYSASLLAKAQRGDISLHVSESENLTQVTVTLPRLCQQVALA